MPRSHQTLAACLLVLTASATQAQYMQPPEPLLGVMRAPLIPSPQPDPTGTTLLLVQQAPLVHK